MFCLLNLLFSGHYAGVEIYKRMQPYFYGDAYGAE